MSDEAAPAAGHNSELTEAEKRALFLNALPVLEVMIQDKNDIVSDIRNQRKRIVGYGFKPWQIDFALKLRAQEDEEAIDRRRQEAEIARFLNHPIGTQPDMFDVVDRTPSVDRAYEDGKVSGARGDSARSPHGPGSEQDQAWLRGWGDGQSDLASGFKKMEPGPEQQPDLASEAA